MGFITGKRWLITGVLYDRAFGTDNGAHPLAFLEQALEKSLKAVLSAHRIGFVARMTWYGYSNCCQKPMAVGRIYQSNQPLAHVARAQVAMKTIVSGAALCFLVFSGNPVAVIGDISGLSTHCPVADAALYGPRPAA
ncbi:MAG: hypothetical protein ABIQ90_05770 [Polaromonas sp.]